jgi:hypothetical protein
MASASPPISAATALPLSWLRSAITGMAPASAKALAKTRPSPWPAPVTIATRPRSDGSTTLRSSTA